MEFANLGEALVITAGVIITQIAVAWRTQNVIVFRICELEKKQDKHNGIIERMAVAENSLKSLHRRIDKVENIQEFDSKG